MGPNLCELDSWVINTQEQYFSELVERSDSDWIIFHSCELVLVRASLGWAWIWNPRRAWCWLLLTSWKKCKDHSFIYCNCFLLHCLMLWSHFLLFLSSVEVNFRGKAISEGSVVLVEVSILSNFVWEKLPLRIWVSCVICVMWKSCTRGDEWVHRLYVVFDRFRLSRLFSCL